MSNPLDWTGPEFLKLYVLLLVLAGIAGAALRYYFRKPGDDPSPASLELDPYETAYLAGGDRVLADAVLASLVHDKALEIKGDQKLAVCGQIRSPAHKVEKTACKAAGSGNTVSDIRIAIGTVAGPLRDSLQQTGLVVPDDEAWIARLVPVGLIGLVMLLGIVKTGVGMSRDRPVTFLVFLLAVSLITLLFFLRRPHRSRRGDRALEQLRLRNAALELTGKRDTTMLTGPDLSLAVALFGVGMLASGPMTGLHTALLPPRSGGSGCGGSGCGGGGGCGGGCGGGGCGGCGG